MNVRNILLPVDFSDCSYAVAAEAAQLAERFGAKVWILTAVETPPGISPRTLVHAGTGGAAVPAGEHLADQTRERMKLYLRVIEDGGAQADLIVAQGRPVEAILGAAAELDADLVVMGTHGRSGLSRLALGSVAEGVIRESDVPVLTFRSQHRATCEAKSCAWCASGASDTQIQLVAETEG